MSPFDIMAQNVDDVIMIINHFIEKGENMPSEESKPAPALSNNKQQRIRVNDSTATGGWF